MEIKYIDGGVCAAKGFKAAGVGCGFKRGIVKEDGSVEYVKKDLAMITSDVICSAAAVYTTNKVKGAPIQVTKEHLTNGMAKAIICNSGNANTCAPNGIEVAKKTCALTADALNISEEEVLVCSTGVIGQELQMAPFEKGIPMVVAQLDYDGSQSAAKAIMTTDTKAKEVAVEFTLDGKVCRIGGIAKGSGMINPNMATMLAFITTDAKISPEMLQKAVSYDVKKSFNQICVDGDTSTNDTEIVMASGLAGNEEIVAEGEAYRDFLEALNMVTVYLAKKMAADGEGATKLIECSVSGAPNDELAQNISKSVISSNLLKAAMFGADANWGRVLCALGYAGGDYSADNIDVYMSSAKGSVQVCEGSMHKEYSEEEASAILSEDELKIDIEMHQGDGCAMAWGCDLTYEYVRINGDYRS